MHRDYARVADRVPRRFRGEESDTLIYSPSTMVSDDQLTSWIGSSSVLVQMLPEDFAKQIFNLMAWIERLGSRLS